MNTENKNFYTDAVPRESGTEDAIEFNFIEIAYVLLGKLWIIVLAGLIAAIAAYAYTAYCIVPQYNSTARVYILNRQNTNVISGSDLSTAGSIKDDFVVLVKSNEISRLTLSAIGEDPSKYRSLKSRISIGQNNNSRFVDITVTDPDPIRAKQLVDSVANVCRSRAIALMGIEDVTIEEYGSIPTSPSSPNMSRNVLIAALAGVAISVAIIVLIYVLDDNISSAEDIEKKLSICVLGSIPDASTLRKNRRRHNSTSEDTKDTKDTKKESDDSSSDSN